MIRNLFSAQARNATSRRRGARMTLDVAGHPTPITLRHEPRARRYGLRIVAATGEVVLTVPNGGDDETALDFLERNEAWLRGRLDQRPAAVPFCDGAVFPIRGQPTQIVAMDKLRGRVAWDPDAEGMAEVRVTGGPEHLERRLTDWLRGEARKDLRVAVARYTDKLGRKAGRITLRDTRSRWGSCASNGNLSFSWRLIMAPPFVLDYVAAHEVAHLREMNHSRRYWALLNGLSPDVDRAEAWLKAKGTDLHRYGRAA